MTARERVMLTRATILIHEEALLSAIWYSDGSGARGLNVGLESAPDTWHIEAINLDVDSVVVIELVRQDAARRLAAAVADIDEGTNQLLHGRSRPVTMPVYEVTADGVEMRKVKPC